MCWIQRLAIMLKRISISIPSFPQVFITAQESLFCELIVTIKTFASVARTMSSKYGQCEGFGIYASSVYANLPFLRQHNQRILFSIAQLYVGFFQLKILRTGEKTKSNSCR
jgi:hypothetical protein